MRVEVNPCLCCGYRICVDIAPNVYRVNSLGKAECLFDVVPHDLEEEAHIAARECPSGAITVHDNVLQH